MRLIVFLFFICAGNTFAGALYCGGKVEKLGLHASDQIMLKLSSMNQAVFICSPNKKWTVVGAGYTTSAEMCSSILSMLMHAKATIQHSIQCCLMVIMSPVTALVGKVGKAGKKQILGTSYIKTYLVLKTNDNGR